MTPVCECGHPWSRHTSGGMCAGDPPDGSECYCVLFPPEPTSWETWETWWLIESSIRDGSPSYSGANHWTHDPWQALRFATKGEAEEWLPRCNPSAFEVKVISHMFQAASPLTNTANLTGNKALQQVSSRAGTFDDKHAAPEFHGQPADEWAAEWRDYWERDGQILVNRRALQGLLSQIDKGGFLRGSYDLGTYWAYGGDGIPCSWLESRYSETPAKSGKTSFLPANLAEQIRVAVSAAQDDLLFERMEELGERLSLILSLVRGAQFTAESVLRDGPESGFEIVEATEIASLRKRISELEDERAMAEQSVEKLRDLKRNWQRIVDEQDADGGPLIENILYWLIEDLGGNP